MQAFREEYPDEHRKHDLARRLGKSPSCISGWLNHPNEKLHSKAKAKLLQLFDDVAHKLQIVDAIHAENRLEIERTSPPVPQRLLQEARRLAHANASETALRRAKHVLEELTDKVGRYRAYQTIQALHVKMLSFGEAILNAEAFEKETVSNGDRADQIKALLLKASAMRICNSYPFPQLQERYDQIRSFIEGLEKDHPRLYELSLEFEGEYMTARLNQKDAPRIPEKELRALLAKLWTVLHSGKLGSVEQGIFGMIARLHTALGEYDEARWALCQGLNRPLNSVVDGPNTFRLAYVELLVAEKDYAKAQIQAKLISSQALGQGDMFAHRIAQAMMTKALPSLPSGQK